MTALEKLLQEHQDNFHLFTYGHENDPEKYDVLQVGLAACFYINQGYLEENILIYKETVIF